MDQDLVELLRSADAGAPRRMPAPPSAASLRRAERLRLARMGGLAVLLLAAASARLAQRGASPAEAPTAAIAGAIALPSMEEALRAFERSVAMTELRHGLPSPLESARRDARRALETGVTSGFRALHVAASAGRPLALARMDDLARRFPSTHGGQCARAFVDAQGPGAPDAPRDPRTETSR